MVDYNSKTFSTRLNEIVENMGWGGNARVARNVGISESLLRAYRYGKNWPTLPVAVALAQHLGVSLEWLAGMKEEAENGQHETL